VTDLNLLDLLDNADRGDLATEQPPYVCIECGREEPSLFLLRLNHSPLRGRGICMTMNLTRAHVTSAARAFHSAGAFLPCCWDGGRHAFDIEHAENLVRHYVRLAAKTWPAERLTWIRTALTAESLPEDLVDELTWEAA